MPTGSRVAGKGRGPARPLTHPVRAGRRGPGPAGGGGNPFRGVMAREGVCGRYKQGSNRANNPAARGLCDWRAAGRPRGCSALGSPTPCHAAWPDRSAAAFLPSFCQGPGNRGHSPSPARSNPSCPTRSTLRCISPHRRPWRVCSEGLRPGARRAEDLSSAQAGWREAGVGFRSQGRRETERSQLEPRECAQLAPPPVAVRAKRPRVRRNR